MTVADIEETYRPYGLCLLRPFCEVWNLVQFCEHRKAIEKRHRLCGMVEHMHSQIVGPLSDNTLKFWIERRIIVSINTSSIFEQSTIGVEQILPKQFRKALKMCIAFCTHEGSIAWL